MPLAGSSFMKTGVCIYCRLVINIFKTRNKDYNYLIIKTLRFCFSAFRFF